MPPPASAVTRRKERRLRRGVTGMMVISYSLPTVFSTDSLDGTRCWRARRPGESPGECADRCRNGRCCRSWRRRCPCRWAAEFLQQGRSRHHLAGLTIAALRNVDLLPGKLDRMRAVGRKPFDRGDRRVRRGRDRRQAGAHRVAAEMHGAGAALADAAAVFGAFEFRTSRSTHSKGMSGGTSTVADRPFTVSLKAMMSTPELPGLQDRSKLSRHGNH